jgi:[acyl-carrier-protein] S-malonyltransferase
MKFCILFPGQGSQSPGMGKFLFDEFKFAKDIFEESSDALKIDMKKLCFTGPESELALTENTQPALLTVSVATAKVLTDNFGIQIEATAGHSIGEYASMVISDVISFTEAVKAVRFRGQAMQSAVPQGEGGMTATLGLNEIQAEFLCQYTVSKSGFGPLSPANYNCDGQIVISGNLKALNWLKENFRAEIFAENNLPEPRRAKLIPLSVSAPFHCDMMKPAESKMADFLNQIQFNNSNIPIVQNVHAKPETDGKILKMNLIQQVSAPVRWTQSMERLKSMNISNVIESGNGSVLKGLLKKIDPDYFQVFSTNSLDDLKLIETAQKNSLHA